SRKDMVKSFCEASGFEVPRAFDISQPTFRLIAVDCSATPPTVVKRSAFMQSAVIAHISASENIGKRFRIFDFKSFVEMHYPGSGNKLVKGQPFNWQTGVAA